MNYIATNHDYQHLPVCGYHSKNVSGAEGSKYLSQHQANMFHIEGSEKDPAETDKVESDKYRNKSFYSARVSFSGKYLNP